MFVFIASKTSSGQTATKKTTQYCIVPRCSVTLAPPPSKQIVRYESNKPIKSKSTYRQSINQSTEWTHYKKHPVGKIAHGDNFRVGPNSDQTPRDNTMLQEHTGNQVYKGFTFQSTDEAISTICDKKAVGNNGKKWCKHTAKKTSGQQLLNRQ